MKLNSRFFFICILSTLLFFIPRLTLAWPTTDQWIPILKGGNLLQDPNGDSQGSRNIVSDSNNDAAFMFNDGQYVYFRLRLDQTPQGIGGQQFLKSFGWGVEIDTNLNNGDYEWLLMVDGISQIEVIELQQNTIQGTLGDPSDNAELVCASVPVSINHRIVPANTFINGDQDYFLDWRFPYDIFKQCTGLTDGSPIRLFFGSSSSTSSLTEAGADLVGGSDLYSGFSDYVTPFGTLPTTGVVRFVEDLSGNTDVTVITAGETLYVRVDDNDQNHNFTTLQTLSVTLTTTSGDSETLTLTETGINTGVYTGAIPSLDASPSVGNNTIEVEVPDEIVTVTYIDIVDANLNLNQPRTDTLTVLLPPIISVVKTVTPDSIAAGANVTYTINIINNGQGEGFLSQVKDILPTGFTFIPGTATGLTTTEPVINGQILTWNGTWTVPRQTGGINGTLSLSFDASGGSSLGTYYNNVTVSGSNFAIAATGDTAPVVVAAPLMELTKGVDKLNAAPGEELIYSVHYHNLGDGPAHTLIIMDTVPVNTTYVSDSLKIGTAGSTYNDPSNTVLTDNPGDDAGEVNGNTIIFTINLVSSDDSTPDSGNDEGIVYFKITIN